MNIESRTKSWAEYLLEALGLGLSFGAVALGLALTFSDPTRERGLVWFGLGCALGVGFRLAAGRHSTTATKAK